MILQRLAARFPADHAGALAVVLALDLLAAAVFAAAIPGFASPGNVRAVIVGAAPLLVLAVGQTFVLLSGGIDLSTTSVVGLTSVVAGLVLGGADGPPAASATQVMLGLLAMAGAGVTIGVLNGACVGLLRMPAFMVTLATGMFSAGLAVWLARHLAGSDTIYDLPPAFTLIGGHAGVACGLTLLLVAGAHLTLTRRPYGRRLRAVGYNPRTASVSGVRVARVLIGAYAIGAACATVAAILMTGALETASPAHGRPLLLDALGATVLGGTSLSGGRGTVAGTVLGVLFLAMAGNALTLLNLSEFTITIVKGLVIVAAALADRWRSEGAP